MALPPMAPAGRLRASVERKDINGNLSNKIVVPFQPGDTVKDFLRECSKRFNHEVNCLQAKFEDGFAAMEPTDKMEDRCLQRFKN